MRQPDLAGLAKEWLREYQSPPEVEPSPTSDVVETPTELQVATTAIDD